MQSVITVLIKSFANQGLRVTILLLFSLNVASADTYLNGTTFGDWFMQCTPIVGNSDLPETSSYQEQSLECALSQRIDFEGSNEPLLKVDLYLNPRNSRPEAVFVLPLGIPLETAPVLSFDNSNKVRLAISHCHNDGCYFKAPLNDVLLEAFLSMRSGEVRLRGNDNETVEIPVSGTGSRAAYNYFEAIPKD